MITKARMDTVYYDESPADEGEECEIRISENKIIVSYKEEEDFVSYHGSNEGNGHFVLQCPERQGQATLHQIPNSKYLEGFWIEENYRGFWKITLP